MKQLLAILILCLKGIDISAQKHRVDCPNCMYYKRGNYRAKNECGCIPCNEQHKKERQAKQAEEKRRADIAAEKYKAQKETRDKAYAEEQQRKRDEAERKKLEEIARKKITEELRSKYTALAKNSSVNMSTGQLTNGVEYIEELKEFSDHQRKKYGLKFLNDTVVEFPYPDNIAFINMYRLGKSNFFIVLPNDQKMNTHNAHIIDMYGNKVKIDGDEIIYSRWFVNKDNNSITVYKIRSSFSQIGDRLVNGGEVSKKFDFLNSMEDVNVHYNRFLNTDYRGLGFGFAVYYANASGYVLNYNMKVQEKKDGIIVQHASYGSPTY